MSIGENASKILNELWSERIQAPPHIFAALFQDHNEKLLSAINSLIQKSDDELVDSIEGEFATASCDWYVEPARKSCASINRLAKGFPLATADIAGFFDDIYIGRDIREVLLNPDKPCREYPNSIPLSAPYFLKTVSQYLPQDFWQNDERLKDMEIALSWVEDFPIHGKAIARTTLLQFLFETQRMAYAMPLVAKSLRDKTHANLATIAECYARKCQVISDDIISNVDRALRLNQPISMKDDPSSSIQGGQS